MLLFAGLFSTGILFADDGFLVAGKVRAPESGTVYLQLVDKAAFEDEEEGYWQGAIVEVSAGEVTEAFSFARVPSGSYGIRAFLDRNGNGKIDFSILGIEPWGTYRPVRPRFRGPRFSEIVFEVDKDIRDILVEIE